MSLWRLVRAYLVARPLMTLLNVLLVALGIATVTVVTLATKQFESRLRQDAAGIDMVVGAKGSPMQLVLAGVYHLDVPPGNVPLDALQTLRANRLVAQAIPLALGDSLRGYRIVGTTREFLALYRATLAEGRLFEAPMEAVMGAAVARATGLGSGGQFVGSHGLAPGGPAHEDDRYTVTGVLAPTGSVIDRLVLTPVESVWFVHEGEPEDEAERRILEAERELTMILVRYASPLAAASLPRTVNAMPRLQAASPAFESARLFQLVGFGVDGIRAFGWLLLAMAGLSVFVALVQALSDRRRELALMRLLGAPPSRLFALLLIEGMVLTALGVALGLAAGHLGLSLAGGWLAPRGELPLTGADFDTIELLYAAAAILLGALAALFPAWRAARTPVSTMLAEE
jgi:putative ABC transport system permease protein